MKLPPASLPRHDLLTPYEVAAYLRVSVQVVYQMLREDMLPALKVGLQYRIPRDKFLAWHAAEEAQAGPPTFPPHPSAKR